MARHKARKIAASHTIAGDRYVKVS